MEFICLEKTNCLTELYKSNIKPESDFLEFRIIVCFYS